jgi:hypothetical protein
MNDDLVIVAKGEMMLLGVTGSEINIEICYKMKINVGETRE